ncbi:methionine adenosyltransferase 2 subunit beta isoform X1 [Bufo gargarizans]|uniref:methionine adenosyltransferase 2 subunit beta isoform X1 n=1 Tax=Bufo gargarizans TaxID=30331 RepID=UPI001CF15B3F|nr:methionine adenosyltransferase 2 subunit beta isoform X1 [Bufo gargarizans]
MEGRYPDFKIRFQPGWTEVVREDFVASCRRVLITGATGLLGRAVYKEFKDKNWHVLGCGYSRARPQIESLNLLDTSAVKELVEEFKPHVIVHCAAERKPEIVENQPDLAALINVGASENLAKVAAAGGAFLIYISTDYVFDGTNPPYREDAMPNPLNLYGKTKLEGERVVLQNNEGAAVLRVPVLYGDVEKIEESAVTIMFDKVQNSNKSANMDNWLQRFPTYVKDVASVCLQLSERKLQDPSINGIFHWSGNEQMTKYEMACAMADVFNLPARHLRPITDEPVGATPRPWNPQLDCSRLEALGVGQRTPFRVGIRESLWPFLDEKKSHQTMFH